MYQKITLVLTLLTVGLFGNAQVFRYRIGLNSNMFVSEIGEKENTYPLVNVLSSPASTKFVHKNSLGFETEVIRPWTSNLETGLEIKYNRFNGTNELPPYYNYFFTAKSPEFTDGVPIWYKSTTLNFLANLKYFYTIKEKYQPYAKIFLGSALVSAELGYSGVNNTQDSKSALLFASGTKNSDTPKKAAFNYGAGVGLNYKLSDKLSVYFDWNLSVVNSNIIDGIPNYNYSLLNGHNFFSATSSKSVINQFGAGLVFTTLKFDKSDFNFGSIHINKPSFFKKHKSKKGGKGKTSEFFPFFRDKN